MNTITHSRLATRYVVSEACCHAPSSGGGKYRRPVVVRVLDTLAGPGYWHWVRSGIVARWHNVDSRYDGPRAAYGRAIRAAAELCGRLNQQSASRIAARGWESYGDALSFRSDAA